MHVRSKCGELVQLRLRASRDLRPFDRHDLHVWKCSYSLYVHTFVLNVTVAGKPSHQEDSLECRTDICKIVKIVMRRYTGTLRTIWPNLRCNTKAGLVFLPWLAYAKAIWPIECDAVSLLCSGCVRVDHRDRPFEASLLTRMRDCTDMTLYGSYGHLACA